MPEILVVSATPFEVQPAMDRFAALQGTHRIRFCITGVGMVKTAFELGKQAGENFTLVINAGIAGSFTDHAPGEVVIVNQDCFPELGAEDHASFITIDELGLGEQAVRLKKKPVLSALQHLREARGITVNTVHGFEPSIADIRKRFAPEIESMEGAAFILAADSCNWPAVQLRAISNRVERRDRSRWDLPLAIANLNKVLCDVLEEILSAQDLRFITD